MGTKLKSQKILVTGGAGYIGSHTVKELINSGYHNIVVVDDLSNGDKSRIPNRVNFLEGDFSDDIILQNPLLDDVETVIHFAAYKSAPESVKCPDKYYINNASKTISLLKFCIKNNVKNFIFSSSAAVYGDVDGFPITEDFNTTPTNPYGWSKLMVEWILKDLSQAYDLNHIALRYFNAGGADQDGKIGNNHQKGEDVISVLVRTAKEGGDFNIFGTDYDTKDGTCIRDLVHVSDLALAHVKAIDYLDNGGESGTFNLGSEKGFSVKEIAALAREITKSKFEIKNGPRREGDIMISVASSEKAKKILGWQPKYTTIENIIKTAWDWEIKN